MTHRRYKTPCRSCCGYEVVVMVVASFDPGLEQVIVTCRSCEQQRSRYKRKRRSI